MANEFFEINDVKNEFLKNVGPQYQGMYSPQQLDIALYMLNDFCNNVSANGIVLMRQAPEPVPMPDYQSSGFGIQRPQSYPQPMQPTYPTPQRPPYVQQQYQDPFEEYPLPQPQFSPQPKMPQRIQQQVNELNKGIQPRQPQMDADMDNDKPRTFVDKIKDMRTPAKSDRINPED